MLQLIRPLRCLLITRIRCVATCLPRGQFTRPLTTCLPRGSFACLPRGAVTCSPRGAVTCSPRGQRAMSGMIRVRPGGVSLVDSDLTISVDGLRPDTPYTLHAYLENSGLAFTSHAHYISSSSSASSSSSSSSSPSSSSSAAAAAEGVSPSPSRHEASIDCTRDASVGGSYEGVERHGLIWSMVQAPGQRPGLRLITRDVTTPYQIHVYVYPGHVDLDTCSTRLMYDESSHVASTVFERTYLGPGVSRGLVRHGRVRGVLFTPPGPGPFPAVLDLFGGVGGVIEFRAALLASRGIMCLHLAYFNYADLQKGLRHIDIDYFEEGVDFLINHPDTLGSSVGVVGVSKGAEIALNMASHLPPHKLGAVVAINGFNFVYSTPASYKGRLIDPDTADFSQCYYTETGALAFEETLRHYEPKPESVFRVEKADAKFLLVSSASDQQIPPMCSYAVERRRHLAGKHCEHLALGEGVGHLVEPCHAPSFAESYQASFKTILAWGGEKKPHARAQETSWPIIVDFLKRYSAGDQAGDGAGDQANITSKL